VFDSGDEFTGIGTPMVDQHNRPYVRFRYGVGDWKAGGRAVLPWQDRFAHFQDGKWHVHGALPATWPGVVRRQAIASGPSAFGDRSSGQWFIFFQNDRFNPNSATSLFLQHESTGFAVRSGGPVRLP
jgi:hypothetical protein